MTTPIINGSGGTLSLPAGPSTLVDTTSYQSIYNKTFEGPNLNSPIIASPTIYNAIIGVNETLSGTLAVTGLSTCSSGI